MLSTEKQLSIPLNLRVWDVEDWSYLQFLKAFLSTGGSAVKNPVVFKMIGKKRKRAEAFDPNTDVFSKNKKRRVQEVGELLLYLEKGPQQVIQKLEIINEKPVQLVQRTQISIKRKKLVVLLRHHSLTSDKHIQITFKEISTITGVKLKTIFSIISHWKRNAFKVVSFVSQRKRKPILSVIQEKLLVNPKVLKEIAHLTMKQRIPLLMLRYRVPKVSVRTLTRTYHKQGVRYRRASYYYNKKFQMERELSDRQQVAATQMTRDMIMKERLIYIDESTFNLWTPCHYLWMGRDQNLPMQINRGQSITCIAAIEKVQGLVHYYIFQGNNNTERFVHFLTGLSEQKGVNKGKFFMDNLSIHKSKGAQEFFRRHPTLQQVHLPQYSSAMNPIEKLWLVLKGRWRNTSLSTPWNLFPLAALSKTFKDSLKQST